MHALNDVTLDFEGGEFTTIVGPSGSGKTTLLNMIGGIDQPTSGEVWVDGKNITRWSTGDLIKFRRNNIGFVFQDYSLLPVFTALENIELILQLQGHPRKECKKRGLQLLESVGLLDRKDERPVNLSGGQQQRVAVARALASRPRFVLADEPTANLDSRSASDLLDIMQRLNLEENMTFIFSTHDQRVIDRARREIVFEDGKIVEDKVNEKNSNV